MKVASLCFVFLVSGCSIIFFREDYQLKDEAGWFNQITGKEAENSVYKLCNDMSAENVKKGAKLEELSPAEFDRTYPFFGKCMYEKGYVFKIKGFDFIYCNNKPRECDIYSKYRR